MGLRRTREEAQRRRREEGRSRRNLRTRKPAHMRQAPQGVKAGEAGGADGGASVRLRAAAEAGALGLALEYWTHPSRTGSGGGGRQRSGGGRAVYQDPGGPWRLAFVVWSRGSGLGCARCTVHLAQCFYSKVTEKGGRKG